MFCLRYLLRYILYTFYGIYANYIYSSVFLFNLSALDILLLDFTGRLAKQDSFRHPRPKHRIRNSNHTKYDHYQYYATRHVPERESNMTHGDHPERLLAYTLICHTTLKKGNPDIINNARNYDTR